MQRVYLVRHGRACPLDGEKRCISRTELPLSDAGRQQARSVLAFLAGKRIAALYASPAQRCMDTAAILGQGLGLTPLPAEDAREVAVGQWEGLTFAEIRRRWPQVYEERGQHIGSVAPPGGESFAQAGRRLDGCLRRLLADAEGDIALVTHGGIARGWLSQVMGLDPDGALGLRQPWGGVTEATFDGEAFRVERYGLMPALPGEEDIRRLYRKHETPENVVAHCRAVAERADALALASPIPVDRALLRAAALLHDLCRAKGRTHPLDAARVLDDEGWPRLADIVAHHHDLGDSPAPEAELLALADRLTEGTQPITLEARFAASRAKCATPEALAAWQRRRDEALALQKKYT